MILPWRDWMSYPTFLDDSVIETLDILAGLVTMKVYECRYSNMAEILDVSKDAGLITEFEHTKLRTAIAQEL